MQTLEIGGIELRKFAPGTDVKSLPRTLVTYAGREMDAAWRKAAAERIDKIRKAPLVVTVVDASGKPVTHADVHVRMTRHAFVFGSCYSPSLILDNASPDAEKYRRTFLELFNTGVDEYAMKWPGWEDPTTHTPGTGRGVAMDARSRRCRPRTQHDLAGLESNARKRSKPPPAIPMRCAR